MCRRAGLGFCGERAPVGSQWEHTFFFSLAEGGQTGTKQRKATRPSAPAGTTTGVVLGCLFGCKLGPKPQAADAAKVGVEFSFRFCTVHDTHIYPREPLL